MEVYWRSARNYNVCLINPELGIFAIPGLTLVSKRYHFLKKSIKFSSLQKMPHELLHFILMEGIVAKKELLLLLLAPPPANLLYLEDSFQQLFRAAGIKCLQGENKDSAAITLLLGPNEFETCPWHCQPSGWCREPVDPFEGSPSLSKAKNSNHDPLPEKVSNSLWPWQQWNCDCIAANAAPLKGAEIGLPCLVCGNALIWEPLTQDKGDYIRYGIKRGCSGSG